MPQLDTLLLENRHGHLEFEGPLSLPQDYDPWQHVTLGQNEVWVLGGSPLNGPCTVTLRGIFEDADGVEAEKKLNRYCARVGARHLGWEKGVWRFWVRGFSRYGYVESESDSGEEEEEVRKEEQGGAKKELKDLRGLEEREKSKVEKEVSAGARVMRRSPGRRVVAPEFSDGEEDEEDEEEEDSKKLEKSRDAQVDADLEERGSEMEEDVREEVPEDMEGVLERENRGWGLVDGLRKEVGPELHRLRLAMFPEEIKLKKRFAEQGDGDDEARQVEMMEGIVERGAGEIEWVGLEHSEVWKRSLKYAGVVREALLANGRTWRVGFSGRKICCGGGGPGRGLVRYGGWVKGGSRLVHERAAMIHFGAWREMEVGTNADGNRDGERPGLRKVLNSSEDARAAVMETYVKLFEKEKESTDMQEVEAVFRLLLALHGGKEGDRGVIWRVGGFLRGFACLLRSDEQKPGKETSLRPVLELVMQGDVKAATLLAAKRGHPRLALLIARAMEGRKEEFWYLMEKVRETEVWEKSEKYILDILGGDVKQVADVLELSWYKRLALQLFYGKAAATSILVKEESTMMNGTGGLEDDYTRNDAFDEDYNDPLWLRKSVIAVGKSGCEGEGEEAAAALAGMYLGGGDIVSEVYSSMRGCGTKAVSTLGKRNVTNERSGRSARMAWHLVQLLQGLGYGRTRDQGAIKLAAEYADELLQAGAPLWAFYVLYASGISQHALTDFLVRHWNEMLADRILVEEAIVPPNNLNREPDSSHSLDRRRVSVDALTFLTRELGIDPAWIHEAQFSHARCKGDKVSAFLAASKSPIPSSAAAVNPVVLELFARAVCTRARDRLKLLQTHLSSSRALASIPHHSTMLTYLSAVDDPQTFTVSKARQLCHQLQAFAKITESVEQQRAREIMGNFVAARAQVAYLWDEGGDAGDKLTGEDTAVLTRWAEFGVRNRMAAEREASLQNPNEVRRFAAAVADYAPFL